MPQNFSQRNLRGRNFKGQDFSDADFSYADIRGADFSEAKLVGANFSHAKAGLPRLATTLLVLSSFFMPIIMAIGSVKIVKVVATILANLFVLPLDKVFAEAWDILWNTTIDIWDIGAIIIAALYCIGFWIKSRDKAWSWAWKSSLCDENLAKAGTNFQNADLTNANFTGAFLEASDFTCANLTHTCFLQVKVSGRFKADKTILSNTSVRDLLMTGNGYNKSYVDVNLKGAYLKYANLSRANLKGANISEATFQGANLEWANLTLAQAVGTDFTSAQMTGACVEAWNIESSTKLDNVDCRFIYLLEYVKPGTDDRERRPSSGEFALGEFSKLFQEVLTTVDLIFRSGVDWKAFITAFKKVQVENEDTELTIQSIENKGDGVVVVRVNVPPDANKEKIHREFIQNYELALKAVEEKYQGIIAGKEGQIEIYRQQLEYERQRQKEQNADMKEIISMLSSKPANVPVNVQEVEAIAERQLRNNNLIILTLGKGDFQNGFSSVISQIWTNGERLPTQHTGQLPPASELVKIYHRWQSIYKLFIAPIPIRLEKDKDQPTNISILEVNKLAEDLEEELNKWLNAEQFIPVDRILREKFMRSDRIQVIIQSDNIDVRRLPWHLWYFFKPYRKAEIALSLPFYDRVLRTTPTRNKIRILSILGDDKGIDIEKDTQLLTQFDAETIFLLKPNRKELDEQLWCEQGWDILCFSGHSSSEMDGNNGWIYINDNDKLTIAELKNALCTAIERGLQIAIFNSCDGLGLANQLASLHIPQIIVMREPVPDVVAQEFLKNFLTAFASGKSFYLSVREARERLQSLENRFPCASWLPVICQNPAEVPPTWYTLRGNFPTA